jgi:hypothetical protein
MRSFLVPLVLLAGLLLAAADVSSARGILGSRTLSPRDYMVNGVPNLDSCLPAGIIPARPVPAGDERLRAVSTTLANGWRVSLLRHQEWDYGIGEWVDFAVDSSTYDAKGRIVNMVARWTGVDGSWTNYYQFVYAYDGAGNLLQFLSQSWGGIGWVNYVKYAYTYDAQSNMTSFTDIKWYQGAWQNVRRFTYSYDGNGNMIKDAYQLWGDIVFDWVAVDRSFYGYDERGNQIDAVTEVWRDTVWVNVQHDSTQFDAQDRPIRLVTQLWESTGKIWITVSGIAYSFTSSGAPSSVTYQGWNNGDSSWSNAMRDLYAYNSRGGQTLHLHQRWVSSWTDSSQEVSTYDVDGNMITNAFQTWAGRYWQNSVLYTYAYDGQRNRTSELAQRYDGVEWINKSLYTFEYDANGNRTSEVRLLWSGYDWSYIARYLTSYQFVTAVEDPAAMPLVYRLSDNYPNPFNPSTQIRFALRSAGTVSLRVYDILGGEVATLVDGPLQAGEHTAVWDARNAASGVYFYRLRAGQFAETKKMLLVR